MDNKKMYENTFHPLFAAHPVRTKCYLKSVVVYLITLYQCDLILVLGTVYTASSKCISLNMDKI